MKSMRRVSLLALAVAAISGCTNTALLSPEHPYDYRAYQGTDARSIAVRDAIENLDAEEQRCYEESDKEEARRCRNKIIGITKKYIDQYWREFVSKFAGRYALGKTAVETGATSLSAAAAITRAPTTASILSALSASVTAFGASAEKNLFENQASTLLLGQMEADRIVIEAQIKVGMREDIDTYSLAAAMTDLAEYANAMSVPHALESLSRAGGARAEAVRTAETSKLTDAIQSK